MVNSRDIKESGEGMRSTEKRCEEQRELEQKGYTMPVFLGQGAISQVWRVWNEKEQRYEACKISANGKRAEREAEILRSLRHPLFPKYRKAWQGENSFFLVMEYIPGSSLGKLVRRRGGFSWKQAVRITMELAEGLLYLHERSTPILFRDIKPDNVMIRQEGRVKLIDVGCACQEGEIGTIAGSKAYGAPEQLSGREQPGVESDVYALGKLLHYILTGRETGAELRNEKYRKIPQGLWQLAEEASCEDRKMRIPDMRTFLQRLSIYDGKCSLKRLRVDGKALFHRGTKEGFYYVQNVRRGMDDQIGM